MRAGTASTGFGYDSVESAFFAENWREPRLNIGLNWARYGLPMARSEITGKRRMRGNNVSHSNIKTIRWQHVNIQKRRLWVPELGRFVSANLTTRDLRTADKIGLLAYAKRYGAKLV